MSDEIKPVLIRIHNADLRDAAGATQGTMAGEIVVASDPTEESAVTLERGAFYHKGGVNMDNRHGSLLVVARSGAGNLTPQPGGFDQLSLQLDLDSRFAPDDQPASGLIRRSVSGTLTATLQSAGPDRWVVSDAQLDVVPLAGTAFSLALTDADANRLPAGTGHNGQSSTVCVTLALQPVQFQDRPQDDRPSGYFSLEPQTTAAAAIWRRACIKIDVLPTLPLVNSAIKISNQLDAIIKTVDAKQRQPATLYVFFVSNSLNNKGGGDTNVASDSIVLPAETTKPNLLAHEIGHYLSGLHPNENDQGWQGSDGSVMDPSANFPAVLALADCQQAYRYVPQGKTGSVAAKCSMTPNPMLRAAILALRRRLQRP